MKQKQGLDLAAVILLLLIACAVLAVPVALLSPKWLIAPAVLVVLALGIVWYQRRRLRAFVAKNLCSTDFESQLSAVLEAARSGEISQDRVDEAVYRVLSWKAQLGLI